ncbi:MAG: ABC transporter permease [Oscillatoriales cyanobacterium]|nr:MAG: ABC transporter permease [Oscillatoriales cyanobacterium]
MKPDPTTSLPTTSPEPAAPEPTAPTIRRRSFLSIHVIVAIAANVFREAIRNRVLYAVGIHGFVLGLAALLLPKIAGGAQFKMLPDIGLASMEVIAVAIAIAVGSRMIEQEVDRRTILILISKPITRAEFILGKFFGLGAVLADMLGIMLSLFVLTLWSQNNDFSVVLALLSTGFLLLRLLLLVAIILLFGSFSSALLAMLMSLTVYLIGNLSQDLIRIGKATENLDLEQITRGLYLVLPDLSRLDIKNDVVYGFAGLPDSNILIGNAVYGVVYTIALLAIAIGIFSRRQF